MDKEQAKFILQSFRPDGADAGNPNFTGALKLATEDRELGEWLAEERAEDGAFAKALCSLPIPEVLRDEILAVLESDGARHEDENDALFIGALASVKVPDNLKEQIMNSMEVELSVNLEQSRIVKFPVFPMLGGLAAAAALVFSTYLVISSQESGSKDIVAQSSTGEVTNMLDSRSVQMEMGKVLQVSMDEIGFEYTPRPGEGLKQVSSWLSGNHHPMPVSIPQGLENAEIVGSKPVALTTGHKASLVTFRKADVGELHMIVLDAKTVEDLGRFDALDKVGMRRCEACPVSEFMITRWRDSSNAYMLLSKARSVQIQEIF